MGSLLLGQVVSRANISNDTCFQQKQPSKNSITDDKQGGFARLRWHSEFEPIAESHWLTQLCRPFRMEREI